MSGQPNGSGGLAATEKTCPLTPATLVVVTLRSDNGDFVVADVSLKGKTPGSGKTVAATGSKTFENLKAGEYTVEATDPVVHNPTNKPGDKILFEPAPPVKVKLPPGGESLCVVEFFRAARLSVKVFFLDESSKTGKEELIGDVKVILKADAGQGKSTEKTTAKETGLADYGTMAPGAYRLSVELSKDLAKLYPNPMPRTIRLNRGENLVVPYRLEKRGKKRLGLRLVRGENRRVATCKVEIEDAPTAAPIHTLEKILVGDGDLDLLLPPEIAAVAKGVRVLFLDKNDQPSGDAYYLAVGQQKGELKKASATSQILRALGFLEREPFPETLNKPEQKLEMNLAFARYQRTRSREIGMDGLSPFNPNEPAMLARLGEDYHNYDYAPSTLPGSTITEAAPRPPLPKPKERPVDVLLNCDLCVLAYHLYHQSVIWPLDPWYEVLARGATNRRTHFMERIHDGVYGRLKSRSEDSLYSGPTGTRSAAGTANRLLDPVVTNLSQIRPRDPALTGDGAVYLGIKTPSYITNAIKTVSVCTYSRGFEKAWPHGPMKITEVIAYGDGEDELIGFEGGTGSYEDSEATWSLMGYVLKRTRPDKTWDAHIVFRGSRSGNAVRAVLHAGQSIFGAGNGNADWVTDLASKMVDDDYVGGKVHVGFAGAFRRCAGTIQHALTKLHEKYGVPETLQVAGHSLGAALAATCCGALTSGTMGKELKKKLTGWPIDKVQGFFFALPPVGTKKYCQDYLAKMAGRTHAPYVADDLVAECSKSVGIRQTSLGGFAGWAGGDGGYSPGVLDRMPRPIGFHKDENSHELYMIRAAIIHKLHQQRIPVPAAVEKATPWGAFASFAHLLDGKPSSTVVAGSEPANMLTRDNLRTVLTNYRFGEHFSHFLELLKTAVANPKAYRGYHQDETYRLAAERVALALEMCGQIDGNNTAVITDTVATQIAALIAYDPETERGFKEAPKSRLERWVPLYRKTVKDGDGIALKADELLGESFNTRIGLGLILKALQEKPGTTVDAFAAKRECKLCLEVSLPDVSKWQKKKVGVK